MAVKIINRLISLFAVSAVTMIIACGGAGGGGSGSGSGGGSTTISGTAAKGAAIANKTVTLKDANGTTRTAVTKSDGTFTIDTTGLTAPFLLRIEVSTGVYLYSVSADASPTTVNITPLTNFIVDTWYGVQGVTSSSAFSSPVTNPAPQPNALKPVITVTQNMMQLWLDKSGVSSANLISTSFSANSSGLDQVLDRITSISGGSITVSDGTTSQTSTITLNTTSKSITIASTTTSGGSTSSSSITSVVPVSAAAQTALDEITAMLNNFANTINTKGASLVVADITPFLSSSLLDDGVDQTQRATTITATFAVAGLTASFTLQQALNLDTTANTADVLVQFSQTKDSVTSINTMEFLLKKESGSWVIYGNQRIAQVKALAEYRTHQGTNSSSGNYIMTSIQAPKSPITSSSGSSTVTGGTVKDDHIFTTATAIPFGCVSQNKTFYYDNYNKLQSVTTPQMESVTVGSLFSMELTKADTTKTTYTIPINAWTTSGIYFNTIGSGTGALADANVGGTKSISWVLPTTYAIGTLRINIETVASGVHCNNDGPILNSNSTSATVTVPQKCSGNDVTEVYFNIDAIGVNGEYSSAHYYFK